MILLRETWYFIRMGISIAKQNSVSKETWDFIRMGISITKQNSVFKLKIKLKKGFKNGKAQFNPQNAFFFCRYFFGTPLGTVSR